MVHISRRALRPELSNTLSRQFVRLIGQLHRKNTDEFLRALLTDSERTMLVKRLAVIGMLVEGYTPYRVWTVLKMSPTTVGRMHTRYKRGEYRAVARSFGRTRAEREATWKTIEKLLRLGMPAQGKGRWRNVRI